MSSYNILPSLIDSHQKDMPLQKMGFEQSKFSWWNQRPRWLRLLICGVGILAVIGLAVGLGVGLTQKGSGSGSGSNTVTSPTTSEGGSTTSDNYTTTGNETYWTPVAKTTWQIVLSYPLNDTDVDVAVYDIDMFDNENSTMEELHKQDRKVICYFSAGSYENWRPDKNKFNESDLGSALDGWAGERWLDTNSENVRNIMLDRLDIAVSKNCDGVDPDNVDGYDNDNGLDLTEDDAIDYVTFLADAAHARNMSIGLKNAGGIISDVIHKMQWSVNEQCEEYDECDLYTTFIDNDKPVFHIEYPSSAPHVNNKVATKVCTDSSSEGFSTIIKQMSLNNWVAICDTD